jgi:hypothetical protein
MTSIATGRRVARPDTLIARATDSAGLSDFGAEGWREGLGRFVEALSETAYDDAVTARMETRLVDVLRTRLRIEDWIKHHRDVVDQTIDRPVFILGLPRTATTALQALLSNDPQWRYLRGWEASEPVPPTTIEEEAGDPRMLAERRHQQESALGQSMHIHEADGPVDDAALLRLDFRNQELGWPAWPYTRWWRGCDMETAYAYHARVLRLLQSRRPPQRWMVKAPWHNFHVDTLARQYPNATFIMCHRDPAQLIPSVASVVRGVHQTLLSGAAAPSEDIGAFVLEHLEVSIARVMEFRRTQGDSRFIDVHHADFNADPPGTVERIYTQLGATLTDGARMDMEAWHQRNRKGAHGEHRYTAEEFGLSRDRIRAAFYDYAKRFDL